MIRLLSIAAVVVCALVVAFASPARSQVASGSIQGQVTDSEQLAVALVSVDLKDASGKVLATVTADETGHYVFSAVPAGTYTLRFTQAGFQATDEGPVTVESRQAATLNVSLKPARVQEQISVVADPLTALEPTGTRLDLAPIETPASIVEVNYNTIETRGHLQIEDAVESMPGVTSGGSTADPSMFATRGFVGDQITLLRDGIYVGPANMITRPENSFNVSSVDLLEGPASVLYGQGAVGGTINVLTKAPIFDKISYNGTASYGSFNTYNLGLGAGGEISKSIAFRADLSYYHSDGFVKHSNPDALNFTGGLVWKVTNQFNIRLSTDILKDDLSSYYGTPLVPASFGTNPLHGVLVTSNGEVLDARMRYNNYNVANSEANSTSYLPRVTLVWQPIAEFNITNDSYYYHGRRHWENAETYTFLGPNNGEMDANGNPIPGNVIARDRFHVFHNQNVIGDQLTFAWAHRTFGLTNKLTGGYEFYNISFVRDRGFPSASFVDDRIRLIRFKAAMEIFLAIFPRRAVQPRSQIMPG